MNINTILLSCVLLLSVTVFGCELIELDNKLALTTMYGTTIIEEQVIIEIIKSPAFKRLKKIHQYGVTRFAHEEREYTRYDHSLGVFFLVRHFGASLEEQIDGLLHDASHTVFSHVGDYVFNHRNKKTSYQDEIHEWYLETVGMSSILAAHGFPDACSYEAKKRHRCLEQDKPDLCADRIEYTLHGGLLDGLLTYDEVSCMMKSLHFEDERWFFDDLMMAKKFATCSMRLSQKRWGAAWNQFVDYCACQAIKRAYALGIVDSATIHFSDDETVWHLLQSNNDAEINRWMQRICLCEKSYSLGTVEDHDLQLLGKFTGTNPWVKTGDTFARLSNLDLEFAQEYQAIKEQIACGYYLNFQ